MKIENIKQRPKEAGYYMTEDTAGTKTYQYFNGNIWWETTKHPVEYWYPKPDELTDKKIERMNEQ